MIDNILETIIGTFRLNTTCTIPTGVAISPDGTQAYIACGNGNEVDVVDTTTNGVIDTIAVAGTPDSVAFKPDGTRAHVTLSGANELAIVNTATATQITGSPFALTAANDTPLGILTTTNHGEIYAYTAKQNPTGKGAVGGGRRG